MKQIIKEYTVYSFDELSKEAQEKAIQDYLESQDPQEFTDMCMDELGYLFKNSDLEIQYDISCNQGSGFNIYGTLNINDVLRFHDRSFTQDKIEKINYTEKEKKAAQFYLRYCDTVKLQENRSCCYNCVEYSDVYGQIVTELESNDLKNIDYDVIEKLEKEVINVMNYMCKTWYDNGYSFFYVMDYFSMQDTSDENEWYYLADGTLFS